MRVVRPIGEFVGATSRRALPVIPSEVEESLIAGSGGHHGSSHYFAHIFGGIQFPTEIDDLLCFLFA
jgi:hypothetical protein